jgi:hypothetical protein
MQSQSCVAVQVLESSEKPGCGAWSCGSRQPIHTCETGEMWLRYLTHSCCNISDACKRWHTCSHTPVVGNVKACRCPGCIVVINDADPTSRGLRAAIAACRTCSSRIRCIRWCSIIGLAMALQHDVAVLQVTVGQYQPTAGQPPTEHAVEPFYLHKLAACHMMCSNSR